MPHLHIFKFGPHYDFTLDCALGSNLYNMRLVLMQLFTGVNEYILRKYKTMERCFKLNLHKLT